METVMEPTSRELFVSPRSDTFILIRAMCSGTAAGTQYGVAKKANIIAVKVLSDAGYAQTIFMCTLKLN